MLIVIGLNVYIFRQIHYFSETTDFVIHRLILVVDIFDQFVLLLHIRDLFQSFLECERRRQIQEIDVFKSSFLQRTLENTGSSSYAGYCRYSFAK